MAHTSRMTKRLQDTAFLKERLLKANGIWNNIRTTSSIRIQYLRICISKRSFTVFRMVILIELMTCNRFKIKIVWKRNKHRRCLNQNRKKKCRTAHNFVCSMVYFNMQYRLPVAQFRCCFMDSFCCCCCFCHRISNVLYISVVPIVRISIQYFAYLST